MASTKSSLSSAEKQVVLNALEIYYKSFERAERAAKDAAVAAAFRGAADKVRAVHAKVVSFELEI